MQKLTGQYQRERMMSRGIIALFCCALFLSAAVGSGYAQAGRRVQKPKNDPPVQKPAEVAVPVKEKPPEAAKIALLIGSNSRMAMNISLNANEIFQGAVVQRLRDSKTLQITSQDNMSRAEAIKRAKDDVMGTHIIWLELQNNMRGYDPINAGRNPRTEDLNIQFIVFEPTTGKTKAQGNVYLRPSSSTRIGGARIGRSLPRCYPQALYSVEFALIEAGIETAERIFRAFSLPEPPLCS